jgi:peptidoglycan/xylan/chitin deacetylase (PgdA/CDA1 family)
MLWVMIFALLSFALSACESRSASAAYPAWRSATPARAAADIPRTGTATPTRTSLAARTITAETTAAKTPTRTAPATASPGATATAEAPAGTIYHPPGNVTVPILLYHNVSNRGSTNYVARPADFRAQMKYLHDSGYETITISELSGVIREGGYLPEKPVVITFDDGYLGVHENAFPILEEFGFNAVVYIIAGTIDSDKSYGYLQKTHIDDLVAAGWEIGSHSISHSSLKTTTLGLRSEIEKSKVELEEKLGVEIRSFSYPYNITNDWIKSRVEAYGYDSAVGVNVFVIHKPERLYFLSRREVARTTTMREFQALLVPGQYELNLEKALEADSDGLQTPLPGR